MEPRDAVACRSGTSAWCIVSGWRGTLSSTRFNRSIFIAGATKGSLSRARTGSFSPRTRGSHVSEEAKNSDLQSFDSNDMPWEESYVEQLKMSIPVKEFIEDPETGVSVRKIRYAAGFTNPWHTHPCAHGMLRA